jgi:transcriptional regulator with XRE-family HTH domain
MPRRVNARWEAGAFELGRRIGIARERAGMTHEDLAQRAGVPVRYQLLIEDGRLDLLPDPTHARGYLRTLAAATGLDADAVTLAYCRLRRRARFIDSKLLALVRELGSGNLP